MKKPILTFILILFACIAFGQDRQGILKVLQTQQQAWNRGDIDGFMKGYWKSDSLVFVGKNGPQKGWQTTLDHYKKTYTNKAEMGRLNFNIVNVRLLDANNAFVIGGWKLTGIKANPHGYFTLLFRKVSGEWKIVVDHTS